MIKLNQRYRVRPVFARGSGSEAMPQMVGRVAYIHPQGRFAELEFEGPRGISREAFWPEELTAGNLMRQKGRG